MLSVRTSITAPVLSMLSGQAAACGDVFEDSVVDDVVLNGESAAPADHLCGTVPFEDSVQEEPERSLSSHHGGGLSPCTVLVRKTLSENDDEIAVLFEGEGPPPVMAGAAIGGVRRQVCFHFTADFAEFLALTG